MMKNTINPDEGKKILELTGGHIRLAKLAYEAVLVGDHSEINADFLIGQKKIYRALSDIWNELTPSEQVFIREGKSIETAEMYLNEVGLMKEGIVQIPLLIEWIKNLPATKEDLSIDESARVIKLGEKVISDDLTKAEYRLLAYLLKHRDQIVERDQIIEAVWTEGKSIDGVTEQAVDQLVFRLRRKIEKDPNNPSHILTVKGRGIKLV
jgi:DNA-binding winged helix-turn-helix (wHTH) protein